MNLYGAVVLITGATSGIGAAAAEAFDRAGARVAIADSGADRLESVAMKLNDALVLPVDISRSDEARSMIDRTVDHFGRIDVLINNASRIEVVSSDRITAADVHAAMDANFIGPVAATQAAARAMRGQSGGQGGGQIVNVGFAGFLIGVPMMASYAASKAAVSGWTRAMQAEWAGSGIQVTEFFPGYVEEGGVASGFAAVGADDLRDPRLSLILRWLVRIQQPGDVAKQLVECVRNPRATVYSSVWVRLLAFAGLFARMRVHLGVGMARARRARSGRPAFNPLPRPVATRRVAPPEVSEPGPATDLGPDVGVSPAPSQDTAKQRRAAKKQSAVGRGSAAGAAEKKGSDKKRVGKKSPVKRSTKRAPSRKVAVLSPEATARVRAAAERAAASAKGTAPARKAKRKTRTPPGRGSGERGGGESADS